ncbi:MAG: hypothetical protein JO003_12340 [Candidatus Eremiobacteraeota bacterium]|nr:hypothetical protein [Candidatus Eremiobacteraeota bacterium]
MLRERLRRRTDLELYRVRRTLSAVKKKLEEALLLSRHKDEEHRERSTAPRRHR